VSLNFNPVASSREVLRTEEGENCLPSRWFQSFADWPDDAEFGHPLALGYCIKQFNQNLEKQQMAMEKKSLVNKKTAPATKSNSTKSKVDTSKPAASKVVAARSGPGKGR
jgi:hypothetical protein